MHTNQQGTNGIYECYSCFSGECSVLQTQPHLGVEEGSTVTFASAACPLKDKESAFHFALRMYQDGWEDMVRLFGQRKDFPVVAERKGSKDGPLRYFSWMTQPFFLPVPMGNAAVLLYVAGKIFKGKVPSDPLTNEEWAALSALEG